MPFIYSDVDKLQDTPLVGSHQCVALVQHHTNAGHTSRWKQGELVRGNAKIAKGTAVATFENGKYPNKPKGNHAALYVGQNATGIIVMDQWKGDPNKPTVSSRTMRFKGKTPKGDFVNPSDNGDALYVIE